MSVGVNLKLVEVEMIVIFDQRWSLKEVWVLLSEVLLSEVLLFRFTLAESNGPFCMAVIQRFYLQSCLWSSFDGPCGVGHLVVDLLRFYACLRI